MSETAKKNAAARKRKADERQAETEAIRRAMVAVLEDQEASRLEKLEAARLLTEIKHKYF